MAQQTFEVGLGLQLDSGVSIIQGVDAPGINGGITDTVNIGSTYTDTVSGLQYRKVSSGIGALAWQLYATEKAPVLVVGVSATLALLDSVRVQDVKSMVWNIDLEDDINPALQTSLEIRAKHNANANADATLINWNITNVLHGVSPVASYTIDVQLSGAGTNQLMNLFISQ